jgi:hypothetical protein
MICGGVDRHVVVLNGSKAEILPTVVKATCAIAQRPEAFDARRGAPPVGSTAVAAGARRRGGQPVPAGV